MYNTVFILYDPNPTYISWRPWCSFPGIRMVSIRGAVFLVFRSHGWKWRSFDEDGWIRHGRFYVCHSNLLIYCWFYPTSSSYQPKVASLGTTIQLSMSRFEVYDSVCGSLGWSLQYMEATVLNILQVRNWRPDNRLSFCLYRLLSFNTLAFDQQTEKVSGQSSFSHTLEIQALNLNLIYDLNYTVLRN